MMVMGDAWKALSVMGTKEASSQIEVKMTGIYTAADLRTYSLDQLYGLYRRFERDLIESTAGSHERRIALANLENVSHAICLRYAFHNHLRRGPNRNFRPGF